ncbi:hypothetical protein ACFQQF_02140 [Agrococcus sp. GCM10030264]
MGITAALVAGVAVAPPSRRNDAISADTAWSFGVPAWITAVVLLAVIVAVPVPARHRVAAAQAGQVVAIVVGLLLTGFLLWRLVVGADDDRGFSTAQVQAASAGLGVLVALLATFVLRCRRILAPERARRAARRARAVAWRRSRNHRRAPGRRR